MEYAAGRKEAELRQMFLDLIKRDKEEKAAEIRRKILIYKITKALEK